MRPTKIEHTPLLGPGYHMMSLVDLKSLTVDPFLGSSRKRRNLFYKLEEFVQDLLIRRIACDLWIDGSYLTEKDEPGDIDIAVRIAADALALLPSEQTEFLDYLSNGGEYKEGLDIFAFTGYWIGHPKYGTEDDEGTSKVARTYCDLYGLNYTNQWLKGIAVLPVWETVVGFRIRTSACR